MKYQDLRKIIRAPYFSISDPILADKTIYNYQLSLWSKNGFLMRLKNGRYLFTQDRARVKGDEVASFLYGPSYLSLETALAWYGFIPEMVYAYVSVTSRINRRFTNELGTFIYRHIKPQLFWGYAEIKTEYGHILIAEPEKALLDYLYLNLRRIRTDSDFESIRLNINVVKEKIDVQKYLKYLSAFDIKKMKVWAMKCLP
jgi:hypothetical protein